MPEDAVFIQPANYEQHLEQLEALARAKRLTLSRHFGKPDGQLNARTEHEIHPRLGLSFIPPELREGNDEVQLAGQGAKAPLTH